MVEMDRPLIVIGGGGHARVVCDAWLEANGALLGFVDREHTRLSKDFPYLGDDDWLQKELIRRSDFVIALGVGGAASLRSRIKGHFNADKSRWARIIHPSASVSRAASLAEGVQIMAGAVVQPGALLAPFSIVNSSATVEHDVSLGAFSHMAPGSVVCGGSTIEDNVHIGAGSVIREGVCVGAGSMIGMGAVVTSAVPVGSVLVGNPARELHGA